MTGLSEVREKLERAIHAAYRHGYGKGGAHERGGLWRPSASADEYLSKLPAIVSEALALLESEQGERVAYSPIAAQFPIQEMLGRGWLVVAEGEGWRVAETAEEVDEALARHFDVDSVGDITTILGTESENGADHG